MSGQYMSGSVYSASLSAALNDYWQALERRWIRDAGQTLRGGTSQIDAAPEPARWQVPVESRGHLTSCPIVTWAVNDSTPANRPSAPCDGWSVPDAKYVECRAADVFSQVGDWAWAKREQLAAAIPDLAGGPELSSLEDARQSLLKADGTLRPEGSIDAYTLPGMVDKLSIRDDGNNNRAWLAGWTGLAANSIKGGFLSTVGPTLKNQSVLVRWLANCYSLRATTIHATRNNTLQLIGQATRDLFEAAPPSGDTPKDKVAVNAASQVWGIVSTVAKALGEEAPGSIGTALTLIDFALNLREGKPNEELKFPQLSGFFAHLDAAVRGLHEDLTAAEADYQKAITGIRQRIAGADRTVLELYDFTKSSPDGDDSDPSASSRFAVDVAVVMEIAQLCVDAADIYSRSVLGKVAEASYADGQLVGRGVVPTAADTALIALREDVESFFRNTTARYLMAADRIRKAAEKYTASDAEQKARLENAIKDWHDAGEDRKRAGIDLDPRKEGVQN